MKARFFLISVMAIAYQGFAQSQSDTNSKKNEIKVNTLYLFGGYPELSYERVLGHRSAIGASLGAFIGSPGPNYATDILTSDFSLLPYYRYYLGKKGASGFFLESNVNVFSRESVIDTENELGVGLGLGLGTKFIVKNSWSIEMVVGGGYNLLQESCDDGYLCFPDVYPRLGIAVGKRF